MELSLENIKPPSYCPLLNLECVLNTASKLNDKFGLSPIKINDFVSFLKIQGAAESSKITISLKSYGLLKETIIENELFYEVSDPFVGILNKTPEEIAEDSFLVQKLKNLIRMPKAFRAILKHSFPKDLILVEKVLNVIIENKIVNLTDASEVADAFVASIIWLSNVESIASSEIPLPTPLLSKEDGVFREITYPYIDEILLPNNKDYLLIAFSHMPRPDITMKISVSLASAVDDILKTVSNVTSDQNKIHIHSKSYLVTEIINIDKENKMIIAYPKVFPDLRIRIQDILLGVLKI